jgi:hypothetical protein
MTQRPSFVMDSSWIVNEILCSRRTQNLIFVFKKHPVDLVLHQSSSARGCLLVSSSIGYHRLSAVACSQIQDHGRWHGSIQRYTEQCDTDRRGRVQSPVVNVKPRIIVLDRFPPIPADHVARMGEKRNAYRLFVGKPEGKETTRKTKT